MRRTASHYYPSFVLTALFFFCGGWGATGHKVISQIAYDRLTPKAKAEVDKLLAGSTLADFSVWPDQVKKEPAWKWTAPWHYADMPPGATEFKLDRDCPTNGCVVQGILRYRDVLSSATATPEEKTQALKFLTHYVGDVHQPLHVGNKSDKGGNSIDVLLFSRKTNLHAVWDDGLIKERGMPFGIYAAKLEAALKPDFEKSFLAAMDPSVWATESHKLAESNAYRNAKGELIQEWERLGQEYVDRNRPVVDEQLTKAGVRLAKMLNAIYDPDGTDPILMPAHPAPAPVAPSTNPAPESKPLVKFVGSRSSDVYHFPGCKDCQRILAENLVEYAEAPAGKLLHKGCPRE